MQTLATMALFSVPAVAPAMARDLGVRGELSGVFVAAAYGFGIFSALASPGFVHRFGAVRVSQGVMLCAVAMLVAASVGSLGSLALATLLLGVGYGASATASTQLLAPRTPRAIFNMVMSVRQIGVPLGGVLAALLLPPLTVAVGWRLALLAEVPVLLAVILLFEIPRRAWDGGREPGRRVLGRAMLHPFRLLREDCRLWVLSVAAFVFSGVQLCFVAFLTVQLTERAGFSLVGAGLVLAVYQGAATLSRPVWGWIADRFSSARRVLALHGFGMAAAALLAGQFGPGWPWAWVLAVAVLGGITGGGYTGLAYAEYARIGGARRAEATGLGSALMFAGALVVPPLFGGMVSVFSGYGVAYAAVAVLAAGCGILLAWPGRGSIVAAE